MSKTFKTGDKVIPLAVPVFAISGVPENQKITKIKEYEVSSCKYNSGRWLLTIKDVG